MKRTFEIVVLNDYGRVSMFGRLLIAALIEDDDGNPVAVENDPDDWPPPGPRETLTNRIDALRGKRS